MHHSPPETAFVDALVSEDVTGPGIGVDTKARDQNNEEFIGDHCREACSISHVGNIPLTYDMGNLSLDQQNLGVKLTQYAKSFLSHFQSLTAGFYLPDLLAMLPCSSKLPKYLCT